MLHGRQLAIEGPIGVGKTSLGRRWRAGSTPRWCSRTPTNPFLDAFYRDRPGAAFQAQLFFLLTRYRAAARAAPAEPVPPGHGGRLHLRQGPDLRPPQPERRRAAASTRRSTRSSSRQLAQAGPRHLPAGLDRRAAAAHPHAPARLRERHLAGLRQAGQRGVQLLLLPLPGHAAAGDQHQRDRLREASRRTSRS